MDDTTYDDQPIEGGQLQPDDEGGAISGEQGDQSAQEIVYQSSENVDAFLSNQDYQPLEDIQTQSTEEVETFSAEAEIQPQGENQPLSNEEVEIASAEPEIRPIDELQPPSTEGIEIISTEQEFNPQSENQSPSIDEVSTVPVEPEYGPMEENSWQPFEEVDILPAEQEVLPVESQSQPTPETERLRGERHNLFIDDTPQPFTIEEYAETAFEEVTAVTNPRKIALILSGGGARGAFQVGAEKYAREVKGYQWDIIAGVSVGALNGAMLAMHRYARLLELWDNISDGQVYTGGFTPLSLLKILLGAKSFYGNEPLKKMMLREFEAGRVLDDLHVGAVSLISGEYVQFTRESLELSKAILASASIPVVWPPVDISPDNLAMVDGGVRNITPVGDVIELEPDEIVIINCSSEQPPAAPNASANVLSIGMRALDIMQNEIFVNDMKEFLRINTLVKEAEQQGAVLHHPKTGQLLKYYPCQVIEPDVELGDVLDFSQKSVQAALKAGVRRAREVLGRP